MFWFHRQVARRSPLWLAEMGPLERHPSGCWALRWPPGKLVLLARTLVALPVPWLVVDPMSTMQHIDINEPVWTFTPSFPEEMQACLDAARPGFGGVVLLGLDEVTGIWRSHRALDKLWRTVRKLAQEGFPIVSIEVPAD